MGFTINPNIAAHHTLFFIDIIVINQLDLSMAAKKKTKTRKSSKRHTDIELTQERFMMLLLSAVLIVLMIILTTGI